MLLAFAFTWWAGGFAQTKVGKQDVWPEENLLICQLRLEDLILSETFMIGQKDDHFYLPLASLFQTLELALEVDLNQGTLTGWLLNETHGVEANLMTRELQLSGNTFPIPEQNLVWCIDDFYAETQWLSTWLPIDFEVDPFQAVVGISARQPLPIQKRMQRQARRESQQLAQAPYQPSGTFVPDPYQLVDWPVLDVTLAHHFQNRFAPHHQPNLSLTGIHDLGKMTGTYAFSGSYHGDAFTLGTGHLELGRKDPEGRLLGPLAATQMAFGEVLSPARQFAGRSLRGLGFRFSNFPLNRPHAFDTTTFSGQLAPGWEVELYRNGALEEVHIPDGTHSYRFDGIPLFVGENTFTLVFHGPQGQERRQTQSLYIDGMLQKPGQTYYRFALNRPDTQLFGKTTPDPTTAGWRAFLDVEHGISRHLSWQASFTQLPLPEGSSSYVTSGLRAVVGRSALSGTLVGDGSGGRLFEMGFQSSWRKQRLNITHFQAKEFTSDLITEYGFEQKTHFRLLGPLHRWRNLSLSHSVDFEDQGFRSGKRNRKWVVQMSLLHRSFAISHALTWFNAFQPLKPSREGLSGNLLTTARWGKLPVRFRTSYTTRPELQLQQASIEGTPRLGKSLRLRAQFRQEFHPTRQTEQKLSLAREFQKFTASLTLEYGSQTGWQAFVGVSTQLFRNPISRRWTPQPTSRAGHPQAVARVFLDSNQNGRYDLSETPLTRVSFLLDGNRIKTQTDAQGTLWLTNLPLYQRFDLALDLESIEDPFLVSPVPIQAGEIRPGRLVSFDFPLVESGDIEGQIIQTDAAHSSRLGGIPIQLWDANATLISETQTEFDGFFLFENVLPGSYRIVCPFPPMGPGSPESSQTHALRVDSGKTTSLSIPFP